MFGIKKKISRIRKSAEAALPAPTLQLCIRASQAPGGGIINIGDLHPVSRGTSIHLISIYAGFLNESSLKEMLLLANSSGGKEILRDDEGYQGLYRLKETDAGPYQVKPGQYFAIVWKPGSTHARAVKASDKQARKLYDSLAYSILPINYSVKFYREQQQLEDFNLAMKRERAEERARELDRKYPLSYPNTPDYMEAI